jgi:hypothetical protein
MYTGNALPCVVDKRKMLYDIFWYGKISLWCVFQQIHGVAIAVSIFGENSLFDTMLKCGSLFNTGFFFSLPYMTLGLKKFLYGTLVHFEH